MHNEDYDAIKMKVIDLKNKTRKNLEKERNKSK